MSSPQLEWYDCRGMFLNEMAAYETVLANYHKFMNNKPTKTLSFAKYHGVCADLIILEDLTRQGFRMGDKRQGMTLEECALLMKVRSRGMYLAYKDALILRPSTPHSCVFHGESHEKQSLCVFATWLSAEQLRFARCRIAFYVAVPSWDTV